jgi:REP element-mobilizing transposase RayT
MGQFKSRKPNRLKDFDYSVEGVYYITICTFERREYFGFIENDKVILNDFGNIAKQRWSDLPDHHNVTIDSFIIMPNHVHGVIIINNIVGAGPARPSKKNNLSTIIGSYKSGVTRQINKTNNVGFKWQRSFYDHIVRTDESLYKIREYITNNPLNWHMDKNNIW